jgi:hypothetical protein
MAKAAAVRHSLPQDGGVRADTVRENQYDNRCEAGVMHQGPQCIPDVAQKYRHIQLFSTLCLTGDKIAGLT